MTSIDRTYQELMKQKIPKTILLPRTKTTTRKPVPYPRTKITLCKEALEKALKHLMST